MHFAIAQWVDFARDLTVDADRMAMLEHLSNGCTECSENAEFFRKLNGICQEIPQFEAPESAVRLARAIFPRQAAVGTKRAFRVPVELVFDSFLAPATAGIRASWQMGWQGLYRAGDCSVDLRIEPDLGSARAAVIGQITNHIAPEIQMADLAVCLKQGKAVVAEARSNRFGEFQIEYEQQGRMQLCIYLDGGSKCIQVPLKKLISDKRSFGPTRSGPVGH